MSGINEIASIHAPMTGFTHLLTRKSLDAGKETPEIKKTSRERASQEIKKVQAISEIYKIQGKIIRQGEDEAKIVYDSEGEIVDFRYGQFVDIQV